MVQNNIFGKRETIVVCCRRISEDKGLVEPDMKFPTANVPQLHSRDQPAAEIYEMQKEWS